MHAIRTPENTTIGFIGTGVMGRSMAGHLLAAGYRMQLHSRTKAKAEELIARGAVWHDSVADVARAADVIFTIVGFPPDVDSVYFDPNGLLPNIRPGSVLVDMTTSSPALAVKIAEAALTAGCAALDAPVSGGDVGAREARLSIMVGGDPEVFESILPLFQVMGKNIVLQGPPGSGQHCKLCNQVAIASNMLGVCEAMAYARKSGLDPERVLQSISAGAAGSWSLSNLAPRMLAGDFRPGFYVKHFLKDMALAAESGSSLGLELPGLNLAKSRYEELRDQGGSNDGTQGLFKLYVVSPSPADQSEVGAH